MSDTSLQATSTFHQRIKTWHRTKQSLARDKARLEQNLKELEEFEHKLAGELIPADAHVGEVFNLFCFGDGCLSISKNASGHNSLLWRTQPGPKAEL